MNHNVVADQQVEVVANAAEISRVAVKLPQFLTEDPELWLQLVDKSFELAHITSEDTKFNHVVTTLDPRTISEVRDIVMNPVPGQSYTILKTALVNRLSASQEHKTRQLLEREEMGDSKPSQFLRRLRVLAGTAVSESLLRILWLSRLPANIQAILATQKNSGLTEVAELADVITESISPASVVMQSSAPPKSDEMSQLKRLIEELARDVAELRIGHRCNRERPARSRTREHSEGRARGRSRNASRERDRSNSDQCWYHRRFGEQARECREPCSYRAGNDAGSR